MEIRNLTHLFASSCALSAAAGQCVLACTTDAVESRDGVYCSTCVNRRSSRVQTTGTMSLTNKPHVSEPRSRCQTFLICKQCKQLHPLLIHTFLSSSQSRKKYNMKARYRLMKCTQLVG